MTYYQVLQIAQNASAEQIKSAYRRLVLLYHPDRNKAPDAGKRFQELTEAYDVLGDAEKKRRYDASNFRPVKKVPPAPPRRRSQYDFIKDVEVGDVDLWNQPEFKPTPEEIKIQEDEKRLREKADRRRRAEHAEYYKRIDRMARTNASPPPRDIWGRPNNNKKNKEPGFIDVFAKSYAADSTPNIR